MGKTFKQTPATGREYRSARPAKGGRVPGRATKKFTHHRERRAARFEIALLAEEAI